MVGLAITGYKYALSTSADNITYSSYGSYITSSWTSGTTFTISGLTNGTYYKIKIRAVNALGDGAESAEIGPFRPNTVPSTPAAATLTAGDATDTFTWSAPASNGSTITKYGYQVSTDNGSNWYSAISGTINGETETANLSVVLGTQYSLSSYKLRVRAFNNGTNGGWSEYSTISASGTGTWTLGAVSQSQSCSQSCSQGCSCGACACGANNGTQTGTQTGTQSRTCYTWTRAGSTTSIAYNSNGSTPCNAVYGGCGSFGPCGSFGACEGCSGCGTVSTVSGTDGQTVYVGGTAGQDYRTYSSFFGAWAVTNSGGTYTWQVGQCGGSCSSQNCFVFSTSVTQCSTTGAYTAVGYAQMGACGNFGFGCTGAASC